MRSVRCPILLLTGCVLLSMGAPSASGATISDTTCVDHDNAAIQRPPDGSPPTIQGHSMDALLFDPLAHVFDVPDKVLLIPGAFGAHTPREAVDVNAYDEVPNSSWFTNRNHVRAVPVAELRQGPDSAVVPAKPWTIEHLKGGGMSTGFWIKDAAGKRWLVKLDPSGGPQLSSGADKIARTLLHAAGYNVPHNEPVGFRRSDLAISAELLRGAKGKHFSDADLDSLLTRAPQLSDGSYSALASLALSGHVLGAPSMKHRRPGDSNDWYTHTNRRELRGLYVICSWIGDWDVKEENFVDVFETEREGTGYVEHYILDAGSSLGAQADGPKDPQWGYEGVFDLGAIGRRVVTLGFTEDPWRRAHQESGIPSVGNFGPHEFNPGRFVTEVEDPAFRALTDRDAYWGAKIVASFSDPQIAAAVEAAGYEDPRASAYVTRTLEERRDKVVRYWFDRVAPLDFFTVDYGVVRFHDLAVDRGLCPPRSYVAEARSHGSIQHIRLPSPQLPLQALHGPGPFEVELTIDGSHAKPARLDLVRTGDAFTVRRVRHG